jgi:hypothetical protein
LKNLDPAFIVAFIAVRERSLLHLGVLIRQLEKQCLVAHR